AIHFPCSFLVANGEARDCQGGLWWGRDSKAKRGRMVAAGVGQRWQGVVAGITHNFSAPRTPQSNGIVERKSYCDAQGITHNFSAPRTPQSNGIVERKSYCDAQGITHNFSAPRTPQSNGIVERKSYCDAQGITHNFSAPRTPQSNGIVERKNGTCKIHVKYRLFYRIELKPVEY
nr:retrotransposon protein [Tanacetum cinerariifolium]